MIGRRYGFVVLLIVALLGVAGLRAPSDTAGTLLYLSAVALAVALVWVAVARRGRDRRPWLLIAAGVSVLGAGDLAWDVSYLLDLNPGRLPDVLYFASYPVLAAGLVQLIRLFAPLKWTSGLLDAFGVVVAGGLATAIYLSTAEVDVTSGSIVDALYPLCDVLLGAAAVWLVMTPGRHRSSMRWLAFALVCTTSIDVLYLVASHTTALSWLAWLEYFYPVGYAMFGVAAMHPERSEADGDEGRVPPTVHRARVWFLGTTLLSVAALGGLMPERSGLVRWAVPVAGLLVGLAVLVRFVRTVRVLEELRYELHLRVTTDSLTGAVSRSEFFEVADTMLRGARPDNPVAALVIDVDRFKQLNDLVGHAGGDDALAEISARCRSMIRPGDVFGRIGGDEFAMVVNGLDDGALATFATVLGAGVSGQPIRAAGRDLAVSVSIGAASTKTPIALAEMLALADMAMYESKRGGRNAVTIGGDDLPDRRVPVSLDETLGRGVPIGHVDGDASRRRSTASN